VYSLFLYLKTPPYDYYDERANYDGTWLPRSATERIILDPKTFVEEMRDQKEGASSTPKEKCPNCDGNAYQSLESDPLLCPPYIYGYSLEMKEWCKFFLDNILPTEWKSNPMDALILPEAQRRLIRSLVTSRTFPDQARDESALKGKGLIMLLHGSPGSGKTLTAELVAEQTKRPLLKLSTGELGAWGERISHELKKLLTYASIWHAIVLIDEADVFLEARKSGPEQFEQNNLVAVFLKQLEYFQGILFLTSNRVGVFDPAIRSRIHLALQYETPDKDRRTLLWRQKLMELPAEITGFDLEKSISTLAEPAMNGREIGNAVNTAKTLAAAENGGKIRFEDLETVVMVWNDFQKSLTQIESEA
jgi:SpoVK/Ycf46/Vps4 family AAA+-type ATPase